MNLYKAHLQSVRDPLGIIEGLIDQAKPIVAASASRGGWIDVGVSSSNSSAAQGGTAATGDFIVGGGKNASGGKNSSPPWLLPAALLIVAIVLYEIFGRRK